MYGAEALAALRSTWSPSHRVESLPRFSAGSGLVLMWRVLLTLGQVPLLTVHSTSLSPCCRPLTVVLLLFTSSIVALPPLIDHAPVPMLGAVAAMAPLVPQISFAAKTLSLIGCASTFTMTLDTDGGQTPLLIVQVKVLSPICSTDTFDVADKLSLMVALPVHDPIPTVGMFAASALSLVQISCAVPASEGLGSASLLIVTLLEVGGQVPLMMVQV